MNSILCSLAGHTEFIRSGDGRRHKKSTQKVAQCPWIICYKCCVTYTQFTPPPPKNSHCQNFRLSAIEHKLHSCCSEFDIAFYLLQPVGREMGGSCDRLWIKSLPVPAIVVFIYSDNSFDIFIVIRDLSCNVVDVW